MFDLNGIETANSIEEAAEKLSCNESLMLMAGGTDVLVKIRHHELEGMKLLCIADMDELKGIRKDEKGVIVIGAATCFTDITNNEIIKRHIPALGIAVDDIGGPQIRNVATIGGNLCNAAVSADSAGMLLVLDAEAELVSKNGKRIVKMAEFFVGPSKTVRQRDEILTRVIIKKENYDNYHAHYIKFSQRKAMDISILNCAVNLKLSKDKSIIDDYKIALGVAAPKPFLCENTQKQVKGRNVSKETLELISKSVLEEINPRDSWRGSREFRFQLAKQLSIRATKQAIEFAGGKSDA